MIAHHLVSGTLGIETVACRTILGSNEDGVRRVVLENEALDVAYELGLGVIAGQATDLVSHWSPPQLVTASAQIGLERVASATLLTLAARGLPVKAPRQV